MTSAKISGMVSTPGTLDTGLSKVTGTVEKGLCATAQASFASVMEQKTSGYGNQQLTSGNPVGKEPAATTTQPAAVADSAKKLNVKENSPTQKVEELQNQLEDTKDAFETGVKEILKDELGVSDEQVEDAMSILGLQWMDLLNPASLSQLVTQLTGTEDACSLLMSEEFTNIMQNTDALVQSLSETLGISKDEWVALQNQLAELTADFNETVDMADGGVQEIAPQTDATITSQDTTVMAATVQMTHTTEETQNVQPEEETEDAAPVIQVNASEDAQTENNVSENASGEMGEPAAQSQKTKESSVNEHAQNMEFQVRAEQQTVAPEEVNKVASRTTIDVQDIMNQITEFAKVNLSSENSSIEMQLNPENLGKVYLHIAATKEGNITAELAVSSETVKTALEAQIADLRTSLNQQGIKVDAVEVTIASHEFERNLEQNAAGEEQQGSQREESGRTAGRRLFRGELDELSGLMNEEEALAAQIMKDHGNTMDVTA
ncbi:flagellar hook-length control protein FliK [Roseburia sp. AF22-2LB]|jgi:flagellar hook-length control protein FliK|uniref:flagellar hook-length control protein FliK n=1 Tax=unclassified Roseburia TaxID=2637578 RepID=UPI000E4A8127|nr:MULTISPECIES: flagellar hook-length control protein FliK [unclassified Roseburia]RGG36922.1 flagellar hook-length control protein FliK [Roseburia sp. AF22-8AC]RGG42273.1 flagellar hook-length control protein FliK [Roseburia sp. AF22-2LB]